MREGRPSLTAIGVAFARAVSAQEHELSTLCPDVTATSLLPRGLSLLIESRDGRARNQSIVQLVRGLGFGLIDHLALRTALIDRALHAALAEGVDQIVLLGAGLDARAHRIVGAKDAIVFEIDHPSTQRYKQKRASDLTLCAREVRYAACDFEQITLEQALASVGFDPTRRSVWIWEGVTMYLHPSAVMATLDAISRLTVPGSVLIASYVTPELAASGRAFGRLGVAILSSLSEPVHCELEPSDMARELNARKFAIESDKLPIDAADELGVHRAAHMVLVPAERIVVAKRIER